MKDFAERLKALRISRGLSQEEFAKLLGTTKQVISRYETGLRTPKISTVAAYSDALNINRSYLFGESDTISFSEDRPFQSPVVLPLIKKADYFSVADHKETFIEDSCFMLLSDPKLLLSQEYASLSSMVNADFALIAPDNSMLEFGIRQGDTVCMQFVDTVDSGDIVAWVDGDKILLRQIVLYPDEILFSPGSMHYPSARYDSQEAPSFVILGKAVSSITDLTRR